MAARRQVWIIIALVAATVLFVPVKSLNCPAWDVWVTDPENRPVSGVTVRLTCRNYSAERDAHETDLTTDSRGHVMFAPRTVSASLGRRLLVTLSSAAAGAHASFGPHASMLVFGNGLEGVAVNRQNDRVVDWTGKPEHMESRIVVTPRTP
jgi:hypothetical protein